MTADADTAGEATLVPRTADDLSDVLREATDQQRVVTIEGGGTHAAMGYPVASDLAVSTRGFSGILDWQPADLTVVVGAGTPIAELESELHSGGQTALLPEQPGEGTVGGAVATRTSGYARLRYGPTRDRILEVEAVTGDGRQVRGGGRVVKNVTGYDLPRLFCGSFGSLGVITSLCLKLWPMTEAAATIMVDEPPPVDALYRPRAVLQTESDVRVLVSGTRPEVEDQARRLGGETREGLHYPDPLDAGTVWSLRTRPGRTAEAVERLPEGSRFVAQHGVGEITWEPPAGFDPTELRKWAEDQGGALVKLRGETDHDPWGSPPPALDIQRRIISAFDPGRVLERGRLPGGI